MKVPAVKGAPPSGTITRLDAVRQALLLFIHSKLQIDPSHRFAIVTLADNPCWLTRGFIGDVGTLTHAVRSLRSTGVYPTANLQGLLQAVAAEARLSLSLGHCPRLVLIYSRSGVVPYMAPHSQAPHPQAQQHDVAGLFTTDVVYLHHKPSESTSWQQPQEIFDRLVSCLEQISAHEAYIFESSSSYAKVLFRTMCLLLAHPLQRCEQDALALPHDLGKAPEPPPPSMSQIIGSRQGSPHSDPYAL